MNGSPATGPKPCPQHVWVVAEDRPRTPALLLAWSRDDDGWSGHVVWAEDTGHIHFEVLPAAQLRPART